MVFTYSLISSSWKTLLVMKLCDISKFLSTILLPLLLPLSYGLWFLFSILAHSSLHLFREGIQQTRVSVCFPLICLFSILFSCILLLLFYWSWSSIVIVYNLYICLFDRLLFSITFIHCGHCFHLPSIDY